MTRHPLLLCLVVGACAKPGGASLERQAEVAAKGAEVMPFNLDKTRHHFEDLADGGLQTVGVLDAADTLTIRLIREHLNFDK